MAYDNIEKFVCSVYVFVTFMFQTHWDKFSQSRAFSRIQMFPYEKMYDHFVRANQSGQMYSGIPLKHELKVELQNKYVTDLSSEETIGLMSSSPRTSSISW